METATVMSSWAQFTGTDFDGAAFLYTGSASGLNKTPLMLEARQEAPGWQQRCPGGAVCERGWLLRCHRGAEYSFTRTHNEGAAFLYYCSLRSEHHAVAARVNLDGAQFGNSVAPAGDVNGTAIRTSLSGQMVMPIRTRMKGPLPGITAQPPGLNTTPLRLEADQENAHVRLQRGTGGRCGRRRLL